MTDNASLEIVYKADDDLVRVLESNGLIEVKNLDLNARGKRIFKKTRNSNKKLFFDESCIQLWWGTVFQDEFYKISIHELKLILLSFKLKPNDLKEFTLYNQFSLAKADERFRFITSELRQLKNLGLYPKRREKLERIIKAFERLDF